MTLAVIIDAIVVIALVGFGIFGAYRGLFQSVAGLASVIIALVGAGIIAATFTAPVTGIISPLITGQIEKKIDSAMTEQEEKLQEPAGGVEELLNRLGLDEDVRQSISKRTKEKVKETGTTAASAVVESMAYSLIHSILFFLAFLALTVLLHVLMKAMDLLLKLPGLHGLNSLAGALVGLIEGALLLFLVIWVLRRFGVSFETEKLAEAHILQIFTTNTPFSVLSFLQ